jgi:hypothetical protein
MQFPVDVILVCIRWYAAYPLSYKLAKRRKIAPKALAGCEMIHLSKSIGALQHDPQLLRRRFGRYRIGHATPGERAMQLDRICLLTTKANHPTEQNLCSQKPTHAARKWRCRMQWLIPVTRRFV